MWNTSTASLPTKESECSRSTGVPGPIQLQAVILFLEPDCQLLTSKRKYDKSGKFKRDANNEIEDSDVEE